MFIQYYQVLSSTIKYYQVLSSTIKYYQVLSYIYVEGTFMYRMTGFWISLLRTSITIP